MLLHKTYREKKKEKKKVLAFQAVHAHLGLFHKFEIFFNCSPLSHGFHAWSSCTVREKECCFSRKCWSHLSEMFSIFRIPLSQATASAMSMICPWGLSTPYLSYNNHGTLLLLSYLSTATCGPGLYSPVDNSSCMSFIRPCLLTPTSGSNKSHGIGSFHVKSTQKILTLTYLNETWFLHSVCWDINPQ